ncbi:hypothetical protein LEP3755_11380 [Leptolyngbya sp. NIES-3755]|nr:hypothetical protein LEP3755_11380 [Leptolyngbya sp. NIES-3755]
MLKDGFPKIAHHPGEALEERIIALVAVLLAAQIELGFLVDRRVEAASAVLVEVAQEDE